MGSVAAYITSTSYLKPSQVYYRLLFVLRQSALRRSQAYRATYDRRAGASESVRPMQFPAPRPPRVQPADLEIGKFTFLNRQRNLGQPIDWLPMQENRLWLYNLHYFEYALDLASTHYETGDEQAYLLFRRLLSDWIRNVPVATPTAWDAYPTSLRITNWLKAYSLLGRELERDDDFARSVRRSLYSQASFLEDNIEYHLLNNHVLENGRALWLAGQFFDGREARRWAAKGRDILWRGLHENILADGGHDERSPMYHQIMLAMYQDVADVLACRQETVPDDLSAKLQNMRSWLAALTHPDGKIALLNDAAFEIAPEPSPAIEPDVAPFRALEESGYFAFREPKKRNYLVFDCGPLGPEYQPAHGHCDTLSYELSVGGERMIVDSGVETYHGELEWRNFYRSTRAHNTVVVDDAEQSEIWHRFRVARRAQPGKVAWQDDGPQLAYATGAHTGYRRLKGDIDHQRWVCWIDRRFWVVCDRLVGRGEHRLESLIHFHPDVEIRSVPTGGANGPVGEVRRGAATLQIVPWGLQDVSRYCGEQDPIQGWYAPEFGLRRQNHVWGFVRRGPLPAWTGYVLWPETTDVEVQFKPLGDDSARVIVQTENVAHEISLFPRKVTLENKR